MPKKDHDIAMDIHIQKLDDALAQGMVVKSEDYESMRLAYNNLVKAAEDVISNYRLNDKNKRYEHDGD